jgi:MYXO-CTERM domain-containing protein
MPNCTRLILLVGAALLLPASASAFTANLSESTTQDGQNHTLTFSGLPTAQGTVTLTVGLEGDFSYGNLSNPEGSENYADGNLLGTFIPANDTPPSSDCGTTIYQKNFTFPASYINDNGGVVIRIDLYPEVGTFCAQDNVYATITYVSNATPTAEAGPVAGNYATSEGVALTMDASGSTDSDGTIIQYDWDCDNDGQYNDAASATPSGATCTWLDDGTYTFGLRVTDDGGATDTDTASVVVANAPPSVTTISGPANADEGSSVSFTAQGTDPSPIDAAALTYSWDWGDGSAPSTGATASHTWADNGTYTITVTATDPEGATGSSTVSITVDNVAPVIDTTPGTTALEGTQYAYIATATDPGVNDALTWSLVSGPATMGINGLGILTWTPLYADVGTASVEIQVTDNNNDFATQTWTITVAFLDSEPDGMADTWEDDNGLDPTIDDSGLDPDLDGLTNLDEFLNNQDPNVYDGPAAPTLLAPIADEEATSLPTLSWDPAVDPNGDVLTYDVEAYSDELLTNLVFAQNALAEDGPPNTWTVLVALSENTSYWWRARADDGWIAGAWANAETFFVNDLNDAPTVPTPLWPIDGEIVAEQSPSPRWSDATDPDRDPLSYEVRVWDEAGENVLTTGTVAAGARDGTWTIDTELRENTFYGWDVRALDDEGRDGAWSEVEPFYVSVDNKPPAAVVFTSPDDGAYLDGVSPVFVATETVDPEGGTVEYQFEVDTSAAFTSPDFTAHIEAHTGTGEVTWDLSAQGLELTENTWWNARVRAQDAEGVGSDWHTIQVFVRGANNGAEAPLLISPEDGSSSTNDTPTFVFGHVVDPEDDDVTYEVLVTTDEELTDVVWSAVDIEQGSGEQGSQDQTSVLGGTDLEGDLYWSARGADEGGEGAWATPWRFSIEEPDNGNDGRRGCAECSSSLAGSSRGLFALLALLPFLVRRRR